MESAARNSRSDKRKERYLRTTEKGVERVENRREAYGWSQAQLGAEAADRIGRKKPFSAQTAGRFCNGSLALPARTYQAFCLALSFDLEYDHIAQESDSPTITPVESDEEFSENASPRLDRCNLTALSPDLLGREELVEMIEAAMDDEVSPSMVVLTGMPGVGKSHLAQQYAWVHLAEYPGGVCQVDAREGNIAVQIVDFARSRLGLEPPSEAQPLEQLAYCWQRWPDAPAPVLIILDDLDSLQDCRQLLPVNEGRFRFLVTTRQQMDQAVPQILVELPKPAEGIAMMQMLLTNDGRVEEEAKPLAELCAWLGYLPLALDLMGKYLLLDTGIGIEEVLEDLQETALDYPMLNDADMVSVARRGMQAAFSLSWERLPPEAQCLAGGLSLLAPAPIPWDLVSDAMDGVIDRGKLRPARYILVRSHLLQSLGDDLYQLHRLTREFFRSKVADLDPGDSYSRCVGRAILKHASLMPEKPEKAQIAGFAGLAGHVEEMAANLLAFIDEDQVMVPFRSLARYYRGHGMFSRGLAWAERGLQHAETTYGPRHVNTAQAYYDAGLMAYLQRDRILAANRLQQAYTIQKSVGGNNAIELASILLLLASLCREEGKFAEAASYAGEALTIRETQMGDKHPETAEARMTLAVIQLQQPQPPLETLEALVSKALQVRRQALSANHPDLAQCINVLGKIHELQERYPDAVDRYREAVAINEATLGDHHPQTASSYNNLAKMLVGQGNYEEAQTFYQQAIAVFSACGITAYAGWATHNLALLFAAQDERQKARQTCEEALAIMRQDAQNAAQFIIQAENTLKSLIECPDCPEYCF